MGGRSRFGGGAHPKRDRRPEVEDPQDGIDAIRNTTTVALGARLRRLGSRFGAFVLSVETTESTNALARAYAEKGAPHGSVFLAAEQTRGRGRWQRSWASSRGGLYESVLLRPEGRRSPTLVPILAAVATAEAVLETVEIELRLRWPNDLYVLGRKLGGVLCEGVFRGDVPELYVVGVGVNVHQRPEDFPREIADEATSLAGLSVELPELAARVVAKLERWWVLDDAARLVSRWRELGDMRGRAVRVTPRSGPSFEATARGLADDGALRVELGDGTRTLLYSEDVCYLRES